MKEIGKLYAAAGTVVLCTAYNKVKPKWGNYITMSGLVVKQDDVTSDQQSGTFSDTWNESVFEEYFGTVVLNNKEWKPMIVIGCSPG